MVLARLGALVHGDEAVFPTTALKQQTGASSTRIRNAMIRIADVLGPVPHGEEGECRVVIRVPRAGGAALSAALGEAQRLRSARKLDPVRVQVDPITL